MRAPLDPQSWAAFFRRLLALILKEFRQIGRNRPLIVSLIVPSTLQIIIFGFALNPTVDQLPLGVVDHSRSLQSRELVAGFTVNQTFVLRGYYADVAEMEKALDRGQLTVGLVIGPDFARERLRGSGMAPVQLLVNAMNANTAAIAQGYAVNIIQAYNQGIGRLDAVPASPRPVQASVTLLYNPGLESAWFIITGTFGILLILNGSLVAAATTIREKENGTIEQLLMTPAGTTEIILAKMTPLFLLLLADVFLVLLVGGLVFAVPVRGSLLLLTVSGALCILVGIGIGTFIATFTSTGLQAQLLSFFVNPPLALLSGAVTPAEAMPAWLQPFTLINPVRHFSMITRGVMIKGVGIEVLWPNLLALVAFASVLVSISVWRFRKQLG